MLIIIMLMKDMLFFTFFLHFLSPLLLFNPWHFHLLAQNYFPSVKKYIQEPILDLETRHEGDSLLELCFFWGEG